LNPEVRSGEITSRAAGRMTKLSIKPPKFSAKEPAPHTPKTTFNYN
jgi:hypothetical protein